MSLAVDAQWENQSTGSAPTEPGSDIEFSYLSFAFEDLGHQNKLNLQCNIKVEKCASVGTKKTHSSANNYNYAVVFNDADQYDHFSIDADLNSDAHIGLSANQSHDGNEWEIVIGGWTGSGSVIRYGNQEEPLVQKLHSKFQYDQFKHDLKVLKQTPI